MSRWQEPPIEQAKPKRTPKPARSKPYARRTYRGHLLDNRTISALEWAERHYLRENRRRAPFRIGQGIADGSMSGGTHLGGGAVDIMFAGVSQSDRDAIIKWTRRAGFGSWARVGPLWGANGSNDHAHLVLLGHEASAAAKAQMQAYLNHRNGLVDNAYDPTPRPRIRRRWNHRLGRPVLYPLPGQKLTPHQKLLLPPKPRPPKS